MLGTARELSLLWTCILLVWLGVAYAWGDGPYTRSEGQVISSRDLATSGADEWTLIVLGLWSFIVPCVTQTLSIIRLIPSRPRSIAYCGCFAFFVFLLLLVEGEVSIADSILAGDWLLACGVGLALLGLPIAGFPLAPKASPDD